MKRCEIEITYNEQQYKDACAKYEAISDEVSEGAFGGTQFYKDYECIAVVHRYYTPKSKGIKPKGGGNTTPKKGSKTNGKQN